MDQKGIEVEHIVVDGLSTDGTAQWLAAQQDLRAIVERDSGMYDAINKGWQAATGDVLSYLNCDEQYLPDTLSFVRDYFEDHPETDILFGNHLVVTRDGELVAYRKGFQPRWPYILATHLYVFSCTMFIRRRVMDRHGLAFDTSFRCAGDADLVVRLMRQGVRTAHVPRYLATFMWDGTNLGQTERALREASRVAASAPRWVRALRRPLQLARLIEKALAGAYSQRFPLEYAIYQSPRARATFRIERGTWRWDATPAQPASAVAH